MTVPRVRRGDAPDRPRAGQVVLVTGASSGIGLATAQLLARQGADLVLASRGESALARAARSCEELGATVLEVPTDVADADAVDALLQRATDRFGRLDATVHCAAVLAYGRFQDVPREVFEQVVRVNLLGTANVARASLRVMTGQRHGHLVVLGSVVGKVVTATLSSYETTKWAIHGMVRGMQIELRDNPGVDVTLVAPGGVDTPIYTQAGNYTGWEGRPPPPVYSPEHVARRIADALERPRREVSVGFANPVMVLGFRALPWLYDAIVRPFSQTLATAPRRADPGPGNTMTPREDGEQLYGRWKRHSVADLLRPPRR